jgi:hypothetical protein
MKNIITIWILIPIFSLTVNAQSTIDDLKTPSENFSLQGALAMFKKANSVEAFENLLNQEDNNVNNLDLNDDGKTDYISVNDIKNGNNHLLILSTFLSETQSQDIATIAIEKTGNEQAQIQIEGDQDLFSNNNIFEPNEDNGNMRATGKGGPSADFNQTGLFVNVWFWPSVQFLYAPSYVVYNSPYRWNYYPRWYRSWNPYGVDVFYGRCTPNRSFFIPSPSRRVVITRNFYNPRRNYVVFRTRNNPRFYNNRGRNNYQGGRNYRKNGRRF